MIDPQEVVIWSADVGEATLNAALKTARSQPTQVPNIWKLDRDRIDELGFSFINTLELQGIRVFDDAKIIEIPDKVMAIAERHLTYRPWMLNVMAGAMSTGFIAHPDPKKVDALKRFADACHAVGTLPCAVTVLTSKDDENHLMEARQLGVESGLNFKVDCNAAIRGTAVGYEFNGRSSEDQVLTYVEFLLACGFTDVVCSPLEVPLIRAESRFDGLSLNTPGVRLAGTSADDQARINTPAGAIRSGATRLVIGRNLTNGIEDGRLVENFAAIAADLALAGV